MPCDANGLRDIVLDRIGRGKLVVVSNREPYVHGRDDGNVTWNAPAGGLVTALDPVMRTCGGTWIAHGAGEADREVVDARGHVAVPPDEPRYTLRRIWLSEEEEQGYYYGFSNQALWPLCHVAYIRPRFKIDHWHTYQAVNRKFADAVLEEVGDEPAWVFVQDYHFALLPRMLKKARPDLVVAHFWHIPWPSGELFRVCPWADEIVDGLLGNDLLGFHTQHHCNNFLYTVERTVESIVDKEDFAVQRDGVRTTVRSIPISVDIDALAQQAHAPRTEKLVEKFRRELKLDGQLVGVGVDRVDYTKGIPERMAAIDRFFERFPDYCGRFTFLQVGPASRVEIDEYKGLNDEIDQLAAEINARHGDSDWQPIRVLKANYPSEALTAFYAMADVCIVSSLHDGMNLVAKEFVSARADGEAVLVLSRFTGAARELSDAVQINPYDVDGFSCALREALEMPVEEKQRRMHRMREVVSENTIYDWAANVVNEVGRLAP